MFKTVSLLVLLLASTGIVHAYQQDLYFNQIGIEQGLNQGSIYAITTDDRGFSWIGTQDGLHMFDGNQVFPVNLSPSNIPKYRFIRALKVFNKHLLAATHDGLVTFHLDTGKKTYLTTSIGDIYHIEIVNQQIWLAGDLGIEVLSSQFNPLFNLMANQHFCVTENEVEGGYCYGVPKSLLFHPAEHSVWIGTSKGLFSYHLSSQHITAYTKVNEKIHGLNNPDARVMALDNQGDLWVGGQCGLYKKVLNQQRFSSVDNCQAPSNILTSTNIRALVLDVDNNLWVGTDKGLNWHNTNSKNDLIFNQIKPHSTKHHSLANPLIRSLHADILGRVWVGTNNGLSVTHTRRLNIRSYRAPSDSSILGNYIYGFLPSNHTNNVYVSSNKGLSLFNHKTLAVNPIISNETIFDMVSANSYIWAGGRGYLYQIDSTNQQIIKRFDASNSPLDGRYIYKMLKHGTQVWVGTSHGLYLFNDETQTWQYWNTDNGLVDNEIYELFHLNNQLWIGTQNGVSVFDYQSQNFTNYTLRNSNFQSRWVFDVNQIDNTVYIASGGGVYQFNQNKFKYLPIVTGNAYSVMPFNDSLLLITTNKGAIVFDTISKQKLQLTDADGFADNEYNYNAHATLDGNIFLGNTTGFSSVKLEDISLKLNELPHTDSIANPVFITSSIIDNQQFNYWQQTALSTSPLVLAESISVNHQYSSVVIGFSNPYFATKHDTANLAPLELTSQFSHFDFNHVRQELATLESGVYQLNLRQNKNITINRLSHPLLSNTARLIYFLCVIVLIWFTSRYFVLKTHARKLVDKNRIIQQQSVTIEENLKFKEHVFYQIQHSLKSPVSACRGLLFLLEQQINSNKFDKISLLRKTQKLQNAQLKIAELVEQLLLLSKTETNHFVQSTQNVLAVFNSVLSIVNELAKINKITLNICVENINDSTRLTSTEMGLFIIFENIMTNAIKYSSAEQAVFVTLQKENNSLIFTVKDTGIGIPEIEINDIFNMFYRCSNSLNATGDGLGLALVKQLVDQMKGDVGVYSQVNTGTTFTIKLPLIEHS